MTRRGRGRVPAEVRFWPKVYTNGPIPEHRPDLGPCWLWTAGLHHSGYGAFRDENQRNARAHRWAYEHLVGPIPAGMELDHLCRERSCVNPGHLEVVTRLANFLRGNHPGAVALRTNRCGWGHSLADAYIHHLPNGGISRKCRACFLRRALIGVQEPKHCSFCGVLVGPNNRSGVCGSHRHLVPFPRTTPLDESA